MSRLAATPEPPYYAVIFSSVRRAGEDDGYGEMAQAMDALARAQPGYIGHESAREEIGLTVSYWRDEAAIPAWKRAVDHIGAQRLGRERWYSLYRVRVARVERAYGFDAPPPG